MDDLQFSVLFNNISLISGQWDFDNERLFAMDPVCDWEDSHLDQIRRWLS